MELTFNKTSNGYIAEYSATTHFNLHIEGGSRVLLYKRTSGEQGDHIASIPSEVVDVDVAVNFPAIYTIVLTERPSAVTITTAEGEVINAVIPEEPSGDLPKEASFTILEYQGEDRTFTAQEGMTWREFCESAYNTEEWEVDELGVCLYQGEGWGAPLYYLADGNYVNVYGEDIILPNYQYRMWQDGGNGGGPN